MRLISLIDSYVAVGAYRARLTLCFSLSTTAALSCVKWRHGRHLKIVIQMKNPTSYLLEEHSRQRRSLRRF